MSLTEESRHQLFQALERALGAEQAATLMEHLPPVGWADVATKRDVEQVQVLMKRDLDQAQVLMKRDLDALGARITGVEDRFGSRITGMEERFGSQLAGVEPRFGARLDLGLSELRAEFFREQRNMAITLIGTNLTVGALVVAAIKLL